jgi:hypothetical protein
MLAGKMGQRYPNLYDADRWRRYGWALVVFAVAALGFGLWVSATAGSARAAASDWFLVGAAALGLAIVLWLRQRFSYLQLQGDELLCRVLLVTQRIGLNEVRRARVGPIGEALERRGGGRSVRPPRRWRNVDALVLRLRHPDDGRLRRLLSRRCVFEDEVVIPVRNPAGLQREIEAVLTAVSPPEGGPARSASRRRRRR